MKITRITVIAAAALALAACTSHTTPTTAATPASTSSATPAAQPSPSPSADVEPQTYEGAKAALDRLDKAEATGDAKTEWQMLTSIGQATMSESDYTYVTKHCKALMTSEKTLSLSLNDAKTIATVTSSIAEDQGGGTATWNLVYENGHWKHQPSDGAMSWMSLSRDKSLALLRSSGSC